MIVIDDSMKNGKSYNGNSRKFGITLGGDDYIVKFQKKDDLSVICEYIASNFIREVGVLCHSVELGIYNSILVNVIKDFTSDNNYTLHSFKDTKQSSIDTDLSAKEYTYNDIIYLMSNHLKMSDESKEYSIRAFWKMFLCDAILANRDRHWGNWGYLSNGRDYRFAPLYDNGACLFPDVLSHILEYEDNHTREQFLYDRCMKFPASLFKMRRPKDRAYRTNYYEMFGDLRINKVYAEVVRSFKNRYTYRDIFHTAHKIVSAQSIDPRWLSIILRRFYVEIITLRYMFIVLRMDFSKSYKIVEDMLYKL